VSCFSALDRPRRGADEQEMLAEFLTDEQARRYGRHAVKTTSLPPDIRRDAETNPRGNLILTPKLERLIAERILAEVEPLREAGKLGLFFFN
jgi:hypothetical protein